MASSANILKTFEDNYGPSLRHKVDVIKEQSEAGLYTIKRCGAYLKKICLAMKQTAEQMTRISEHEITKTGRIHKDAMPDPVALYECSLEVITKTLEAQTKFAADLQAAVVDKLASSLRDLEAKRKRLLQQEDKYQTTLRGIHSTVKSRRADCIKQWQALQDAEKARDQADDEAKENASNPKLVKASERKQAKMAEEYTKARAKTHKMFAQFESYVRDANEEQKSLHSRDLTLLCQNYELLELERMEEMRAKLLDFHRIHTELITAQVALGNTLKQSIDRFDGRACVRQWASKMTSEHGKQPPLELIAEGLPCPAMFLERPSKELDELLALDVKSVLSGKPLTTTLSAPRKDKNLDYDDNEDLVSPDPQIVVVRAVFDFQAQDEDDLSFDPGDLILITSPEVKTTDVGEGAKGSQWIRGSMLDSTNLDNRKQGTLPSNYVEPVPVDKNILFRHFFEIPSGMRRFLSYLKSEYSQENLEFIDAVNQYRRLPDDQLLGKAQEIVGKYVLDSGEAMVNLNGITKKAVETAVNEGHPTRGVFDAAQKEIFELLSRDSFHRFKKTPLFARWLELTKKMELGRRFFHTHGPSRQSVVLDHPSSPASPGPGHGQHRRYSHHPGIGSPTVAQLGPSVTPMHTIGLSSPHANRSGN